MSLCGLGGVFRARRIAALARSSVVLSLRVMKKSKHPPFDKAKIEAESAKLRDAIASLIIAWSHLESTLSVMLATILRDKSGRFASAIYYSPASADVRIKIVDSAFNVLSQISKEQARIMECWRRTVTHINRAKAMRNTVAHSVIGFSPTQSQWHTRLVRAPYDFRKDTPADSRHQLPGMSANDITQATDATNNTSSEIGRFIEIVEAVAADNKRALQDRLLELEGGRLTATPLKNAQKPPKRKRQP
jgi:hypothetical protein